MKLLLVNVAKGITWAITYSLVTAAHLYEPFVPAIEHHGGVEYKSHKPVSYSLKELPRLAMALQLTSTMLADSGATQPAHQAARGHGKGREEAHGPAAAGK
ncbi:hypothetical protein QTP88_016960 [Uroleucon formosanum]